MKSWNLAATLLALTGALVALDLSGTIGVQLPGVPGATLPTTGASPVLSSALANADAEERDDEPDAALVNAFLVWPRNPALPVTNAAVALRYD